MQKKIFSLMLALCMLLSFAPTASLAANTIQVHSVAEKQPTCIIPMSTLAVSVDETTESDAAETLGSSGQAMESEVESLREKNSKTYIMSDGTYQCVVFAEDIHYEDTNGTLQEINNAIETTTSKDGYSFANTENSWHTYFADKLSQNDAITMEKGDYSVSFSLSNVVNESFVPALESQSRTNNNVPSDATLSSNLTNQDVIDNPLYDSLTKRNNVILYKDVLEGVDIIYTVKNNCLKEDIILKNSNSTNTFEFKLNITNLAVSEQNGVLSFVNNKGESIFELAPMYMEDANGRFSDEISYDIVQGKEGYTITIIADIDFLSDSKTVYPVVIDPSIMVTGESNTYDTCVDQQYPSSNYYTRENLWTGGKLGTNAMRTFIKFNLPTSINASSITSAVLRIKKREFEPPTIQAYRITSNWNSNSVTWNNQPSYTTVNASMAATLDTGAWYKMTVTTMVKNWKSGTNVNYGFCLKQPAESNTAQKTKFYSSDAPSPNKPELVINYTEPSSYTITYYGNGHTSGSVPASQTVSSGASVTLRSNTGNLAKTGYAFAGWNTHAAGTGTSYQAGQTITMPGNNLNLYAKWRGTVTYNANGGSGTVPSSQTFYSGNAITAPACQLTKSGYHFYSWNTEADGTGINVKAGTSYLPDGNTTLYAKWVKRYNLTVYYTPGMTDAEITHMNNAIDDAVETYLRYGIQIVLSTASSSTELNYRTTSTICEVINDPTLECSGTCGTRSECASKHHRNCAYYLDKLQSNERILRIVPWILCDSTKTTDARTDSIGGKNLICNSASSDLDFLITHELAHTFGLKDSYTDPSDPNHEPNCTKKCIMHDRSQTDFCEYCANLLPN